eukprot:TRINITY_DN4540_c1_g1_i2.p1 TRINITY_DN4540_c1_g1~~TRINITY_DN4540_c1_g1_i2.p1  ORF type:complete len:223 (+),score=28.50 TRINITY_DN4540_c1_g1_i2:79-747(+)
MALPWCDVLCHKEKKFRSRWKTAQELEDTKRAEIAEALSTLQQVGATQSAISFDLHSDASSRTRSCGSSRRSLQRSSRSNCSALPGSRHDSSHSQRRSASAAGLAATHSAAEAAGLRASSSKAGTAANSRGHPPPQPSLPMGPGAMPPAKNLHLLGTGFVKQLRDRDEDTGFLPCYLQASASSGGFRPVGNLPDPALRSLHAMLSKPSADAMLQRKAGAYIA